MTHEIYQSIIWSLFQLNIINVGVYLKSKVICSAESNNNFHKLIFLIFFKISYNYVTIKLNY